MAEGEKRLHTRRQVAAPCLLVWTGDHSSAMDNVEDNDADLGRLAMDRLVGENQAPGITNDVSLRGVGIMFRSFIELTPNGENRENVVIRMPEEPEEIVLRARPVRLQPWIYGSLIGFKIELIERGGGRWEALCDNGPH